ncbi:hypothetical protein CLOACE_08000 [Clostridium acetireducens DSM 10703]|uniref:Flagellar protein n=1 Tax=Clostridium acetireducens DSM 10703 TaxID=1121290 RepID=A0A1E8F082_9CLOT|nr:flagellar biosynthetic protein FliO [Clostridium acetireducens]OFI06817.1 hypothetical protein CLOACE_08000 [Clostridium acetireducens DSM 10703]
MQIQIWISIIKMLIFLCFIIFLIYLTAKIGGSKFESMQKNKYIKILERIPISKENSLLIIQIGSKGYVISSTSQSVEILLEIDDEEINKIKYFKSLKNQIDVKDYLNSTKLKYLLKKLKIKKEDNNE